MHVVFPFKAGSNNKQNFQSEEQSLDSSDLPFV